jgi:hypothetical protein
LETDETVVRQAAALTLAKILEGLDKDAFAVSLLRERIIVRGEQEWVRA